MSPRVDTVKAERRYRSAGRLQSHNIAVCAVARKLAMLAWHLLQEGKSYRYAKPQTVQAKLAKLRVAG